MYGFDCLNIIVFRGSSREKTKAKRKVRKIITVKGASKKHKAIGMTNQKCRNSQTSLAAITTKARIIEGQIQKSRYYLVS